MFRSILFIFCLFFLWSCSSSTVVSDELTEKELYLEAKKALDNGYNISAIAKYEELDARFPFGRFADQAQLDLIYAHFKNLDHLSSKLTAERFIRQHPGHVALDYAWYMKGMSSYKLDQGILARYFPNDFSSRDLGAARDAYDDFAQLAINFPDSKYAPDARARMLFIRNKLAEYEVNAGQYYLRREAYVAAINRGQNILKYYQGTPAIEDALILMAESYDAMGEDRLASAAREVLAANFPPKEEQEKERRWLQMITWGHYGLPEK